MKKLTNIANVTRLTNRGDTAKISFNRKVCLECIAVKPVIIDGPFLYISKFCGYLSKHIKLLHVFDNQSQTCSGWCFECLKKNYFNWFSSNAWLRQNCKAQQLCFQKNVVQEKDIICVIINSCPTHLIVLLNLVLSFIVSGPI